MGADGAYKLVRKLGPGGHFGEVALVRNIRRTMSVRSVCDSQLLCLSRDAFDRILGSIRPLLKQDYGDQDCTNTDK